MFDVLKTAHRLGMELVPRTKSYTKFVKLYDALCKNEKCYWGVKLLGDGLEDWEIQHLQRRGLQTPRPDIVIGSGDPIAAVPLEVLKPKDPVFYLTMIEKAEASFSLMLDGKSGVILEGSRGDSLWAVRRGTPEFRISSSGFEYGKVPEPFKRLWAKANMIEIPKRLVVVYEGWLYKDGTIKVYDAEVSAPLN